MNIRHDMFRYWAKTDEEGSFHLLPFHGLDVAACAVILLRLNPGWMHRLKILSGLSERSLNALIPFLVAMHDLGKFSASFQSLRKDLYQKLQDPRHANWPYMRHDSLGWWLWSALYPEQSGRRIDTDMVTLSRMVRAVMGHHGLPPVEKPDPSLKDYCTDSDLKAASDYLDKLFELTEIDGINKLKQMSLTLPTEFSWTLAGLTTLADWIGSNRIFFPYHNRPHPLSDYWTNTLERAHTAIERIGLTQPKPSSSFVLKDCFKKTPQALHPTPLQQWAQNVTLDDKPMLFILEDVTGAGKTEAALLLASRLLQQTQATGIYFALPTMATANGLYERIEPVFARLFQSDEHPNLVLAHSKARLQDTLWHLGHTDHDYGDNTQPASAHATEWLQDNRKKALLAQVGIGTIDQALMSTLPIRHQSLRLQGLLGKVLIVDEAHACDAYMNELLARLLHYHAQSGGSAIILSATLPRQQKEQLATAFLKGLGQTDPVELDEPAYPLATVIGIGRHDQTTLDTRSDVARGIDVRFIRPEEAYDLLHQCMKNGQCACWIRNTIKDATESFRTLGDHSHAELFHARFTLHHRLEIEKRVLARFGKHSTHSERTGRILIATQVIEQSLDLDFDVMITDLTPIDLLIQRAGRLCRHRRDAHGNPVDGPDQRGTPVLYVVTPEWSDDPDANWLRSTLPGTARVYENMDGHLWHTMKLLREQGGWQMPKDARKLIEGVYGADPFDLPESLRDIALDAEGEQSSQRSFARFRALDWSEGYRHTTQWQDKELDTLTRLGEPAQPVWLARMVDDTLEPLCLPNNISPQDPLAWHLNSISLPYYLANEEIRPDPISEEKWQEMKQLLPGEGRHGIVLLLSPTDQSDIWQGTLGLRDQSTQRLKKRTVCYSIRFGMTIQ